MELARAEQDLGGGWCGPAQDGAELSCLAEQGAAPRAPPACAVFSCDVLPSLMC